MIKKLLQKYKKNKLGSLEVFWDLKDVVDGVVVLKNGIYRAVLEVFPSNFSLLSEEEQIKKIVGFEEVLRDISAKYPLRVLIQTRSTDIKKYLKYFEIRHDVKSLNTYKEFLDYSDFLISEIEQRSVLKKNFYIILEFSNSEVVDSKNQLTLTDIKLNLSKLLQKFKEDFLAVDISSKILDTDGVVKVMMNTIDENKFLLNRPFYTNIESRKEEAKKSKLPYSIINTISPDTIEELKDHIIVDDKSFIKTLFVSNIGTQAMIGWFNNIIKFQHASDIVITLTSKNVQETLLRLKDKKNHLETKKFEQSKKHITSNTYDEILGESIFDQENSILRGEVKPVDIEIDISFRSDNKESLKVIVNSFKDILSQKLMSARVYHYEQLDAFKKVFIGGISKPQVNNFRDIDTHIASYSFPFISPSVNSRSGLFYGIDKQNQLVFIDRLKMPNYNRCVIADSGSGKSFWCKLDTMRSNMIGYKTFIIDPENEYEKITQTLGGKYIVPSADSSFFINPFFIENQELLAKKVDFTLKLFQELCGDYKIDKMLEIKLSRAVREVYAVSLEQQKQVVLVDFVNEINKEETLAKVSEILSSYLDQSHPKHFLFNKQQNLSFEDTNLVTFGMKYVDDRELVISIILQQFWNYINKKEYKHIFKNIVIDEAQHLFRKELILDELLNLALRGRKYNCGLTTIVQSIDHFYQFNNVASNLLNQSAVTLLLKHKTGESFNKLIKHFALNEKQQKYMSTVATGEGLLILAGQTEENSTNNNIRLQLKIIASKKEAELCSTSPNQEEQ